MLDNHKDKLKRTNKVSVKLEQVAKATGARPALYLVYRHGSKKIVGMLEKWGTTEKGCTHPWKAYKGVGNDHRFLGAFYAADGGKEAAIDAILNGVKEKK